MLNRSLLLVLAATLIAGCATTVFNPPANQPLTRGMPPGMGEPEDVMHENSIVLSFSGGGLRAAAFAHGVLTALESVKTDSGDLLEDLAMITSVSGGSLAAAHYGVFGRAGLVRFREDVLQQNFESGMRLSLSPANFLRILGGGLNVRENFGDVLDGKVFHGATFADIYRRGGPGIRINATDLYHRVPFPFIPALFGVLCSDLSRFSVADAVAASMAVPVVFAPIVVRTYPDRCEPLPPFLARLQPHADAPRELNAIAKALAAYRDPRTRYIKLADGGLTDNFGVSTLTQSHVIYGTPHAPMSEHDAVTIRRLLVVVVDASQGPHGDWIEQPSGPAGLELAFSATDAAIDAAARHAADAFERMVADWERSIVEYRCALTPADLKRLRAPARWECTDVKFSLAYLTVDDLPKPVRMRIEAVPTRLALDPAEIDTIIGGGRDGLLALQRLQGYVRGRIATSF